MAIPEVTYDHVNKRAEFDLDERFDEDYIETTIGDARRLALRTPTVRARLEVGVLDPEDFIQVVAAVALRVFRNPGGYSAESEGGVAVTHNGAVASGRLWLTDDDYLTLTGYSRPKGSNRLPFTASIGSDYGFSR